MKKLPHGFRLATSEERPTFNRMNNCTVIRVWEDKPLREAACPNRQLDGTAGFCEHHALQFLRPEEYAAQHPEAQAVANEEVAQ